jgi:hypothetical protein
MFDDYHKGIKFKSGSEIIGLTTRDAEAFAGLSGANLLFIVDEASGFPAPIFDAVFGNLAGGGKVLLTGNPTRTSGGFFDAFHSKRAAWKTLHISSRESPNFHGENIPGLATPSWLEWAKLNWGEGSPAWDVRVEGNFPKQDSNTVIALAEVEDAIERWQTTDPDGPVEVGLDVARFGDDKSVMCVRRGHRAVSFEVLPPGDGPDTANLAANMAIDAQGNNTNKPRIKVDVIGVGASVYDTLARRKDVEAVPVNVAERATDEERYHSLRDQLWFGVRDWLRDGGAIPSDSTLESELVAPTYTFDNRARFQVESKDQIKKRIKRSPNHADALALAIYPGNPALRGVRTSQVRTRPIHG